MRILHFAGPSNSGKTRLIEALLPHLPAVQILKWSHHSMDADSPNSDTERFGRLGPATLLGTPEGLIWRGSYSRPLIYQMLADNLAETALVVVEGDKDAPGKKIWLGAEPPPSTSGVSLCIGPQSPQDREISWIASEIPLGDEDIRRLAKILTHAWETFTYTIYRRNSAR